MVEPRHLSRSPLREAVIDVRVTPIEGVDPGTFRQLKGALGGDYPVVQNQLFVEGQLTVGTENVVNSSAKSGLLGVMFRSSDEKKVVQFRVDGFTFSRLAPYTNWDEVFPEAMKHWEAYRTQANPQSVVRVAVRYINDLRFDVPLEPAEYLTAVPAVAPGLPKEVVNFLSSITVRDSETEAFVTINHSFGGIINEKEASIILDIDAYKLVDEIPAADSDQLYASFLQLRHLKNSVFFKSITEAAVERFE